ncbi:MAG: 16S rRNA (cytosine(1402)-N(4))-methyltransferase RsmH [Candidatus Falkowbacteria bacterium]|nr:16S rRNA (cytosine(1402)-N(4))-methyltransferase RsmH [Candidatus Falkowbacteria bacterium]
MYSHIPVMLPEVLKYLQPKKGENIFDGTLGGANYSLAIAKAVGPSGRVFSTDLDLLAIDNAKERAKIEGVNNISLIHDNFGKLAEIAEKHGPFDGAVFDLGLSSAQLDDQDRGFSFQGDRPLSMSFSQDSAENEETENILRYYSLHELTDIFRLYGDEPKAYFAAKLIVEYRKKKVIKTTGDLLEALAPILKGHHRTNPATRIFQALRIATNGEFKNLENALAALPQALKPGARVIFVSFHSGEDRIVKNYFRQESTDCICPSSFLRCVCGHKKTLKIITKKPLIPSEQESEENPRARSSKLRAAIRV